MTRRRRRIHSIDGVSQPQSWQHRQTKQLGNFGNQEGFSPSGSKLSSSREDQDIDTEVEQVDMTDEPPRPKRKKKIGFKKIFKLTAALTMLAVLFVGGFLFAKTYSNLQRIFQGDSSGVSVLRENVDPAELTGEGDGRVNILVTGRGGPGEEGPDLTDTIIVASIDPIAKEAVMLSIPRDLFVEVPGYGGMKINQVLFTGKEASLNEQGAREQDNIENADEAGLELLDRTVSDALGIPIHYHGIIDFDGFEKMVDTLGGVEIDAPAPVHELMEFDGKPYVLDVKPGRQKMDGFKALAYARSRFTSPRGDFDRSERQRLIILAVKEKMLSLGTLSNPARVANLLDDLGDSVKTNMSLDDMRQLQQLADDIGPGRVISAGLSDPPNNYITTGAHNGLSIVMPSAGLGNYQDVQDFIHNIMLDSFIREENPKIVILNGTSTPGVAQTKADELSGFGYNIVRVGNADRTNYSDTQLIDLRGGQNKYTRRYLELRLNTSAEDSLDQDGISPGEADFVIIIGQNG